MYFNPFENLMYLCDGKAEFSVAITPVFIVPDYSEIILKLFFGD